jgi:hypothetical protein
MKLSIKKVFTIYNIITFGYIVFLITIVYALISKKLVIEGMWTKSKCGAQKTKTKCNKSNGHCKWSNNKCSLS